MPPLPVPLLAVLAWIGSILIARLALDIYDHYSTREWRQFVQRTQAAQFRTQAPQRPTARAEEEA